MLRGFIRYTALFNNDNLLSMKEAGVGYIVLSYSKTIAGVSTVNLTVFLLLERYQPLTSAFYLTVVLKLFLNRYYSTDSIELAPRIAQSVTVKIYKSLMTI